MASKIADALKETFNTTPRAIRWLLLIAAFVVVLILLFLLTNKQKPIRPAPQVSHNIDLIVLPDANITSFLNIEVGEKKQQVFNVSATYNAIIDSVDIQGKIADISFDSGRCSKASKSNEVDSKISCQITVTFAPSNPDLSGDVTLVIGWRDAEDAPGVNPQTKSIVIPYSAKRSSVVPEPVKPIETFDDDDYDDYDTEPTEPDPAENQPFGKENIFKPAEETSEVKRPAAKVERCSDFAMPGYSTTGAHIGWIKPRDGRYEFHPFSDVNCNNPTGIYNPDTGIITSIDGSGKKIGTDADHVGYTGDINSIPKLTTRAKKTTVPRESKQISTSMNSLKNKATWNSGTGGANLIWTQKPVDESLLGSADEQDETVFSSQPYDRTFILRQFKPIPATIVSDVRADPSVYGCTTKDCTGGSGIPVRATVDRNVYSDNGRTIVVPTGTLLMGYLTGELPGPYKSIGRMQIKWYQFIRPDGVEFNFAKDQDPYSADSQGRVGVPGYGSTDYVEQMVMPLLTAIIPAAVNMIAPIADTFVNQIDLDNNTVVQSGKVRSSELAKNEVISAWNKVAQKLMVDALDNTVPPFSIAAGTRITVYSPVDLIVTCGDPTDGANAGKKCAIHKYETQKHRRKWKDVKGDGLTVNYDDPSWTGQVRSFNIDKTFCTTDSSTGNITVDTKKVEDIQKAGYDYRTVLAYCQSLNYEGINQAKWNAYYKNAQSNGIQGVNSEGKTITLTKDSQEYNEQVLGLKYNTDNEGNKTTLLNPFESAPSQPSANLSCDGVAPDQFGCCPGETYTDMGEQGVNCCPDDDPDGPCYPPYDVN